MFTDTKFGQPINISLIETVLIGHDDKGPPEGNNWKVLAMMNSGRMIPLAEYKTKAEAEEFKRAELIQLLFNATSTVVQGRMPGIIT
jgi:hypothetical protein